MWAGWAAGWLHAAPGSLLRDRDQPRQSPLEKPQPEPSELPDPRRPVTMLRRPGEPPTEKWGIPCSSEVPLCQPVTQSPAPGQPAGAWGCACEHRKGSRWVVPAGVTRCPAWGRARQGPSLRCQTGAPCRAAAPGRGITHADVCTCQRPLQRAAACRSRAKMRLLGLLITRPVQSPPRRGGGGGGPPWQKGPRATARGGARGPGDPEGAGSEGRGSRGAGLEQQRSSHHRRGSREGFRASA